MGAGVLTDWKEMLWDWPRGSPVVSWWILVIYCLIRNTFLTVWASCCWKCLMRFLSSWVWVGERWVNWNLVAQRSISSIF